MEILQITAVELFSNQMKGAAYFSIFNNFTVKLARKHKFGLLDIIFWLTCAKCCINADKKLGHVRSFFILL